MRRLKMLPVGFLALVSAIAACNDPDGDGDTTTSSSSSSSSSSGSSSGGGSSNVITGSAKDTFWSQNGDELVYVPSRWAGIEAIADTTYPGTISNTGDISIPNVPMGMYWLALTAGPSPNFPNAPAWRTFVETDARVVDIGRVYTGRSDIATMTQSSPLVIDATFGTPIQVYTENMDGEVIQPVMDEVQFVSRGAGLWGNPDMFAETTPADGATQVQGWTFNMQDTFIDVVNQGTPLVDASKGDDLVVTHGVATLVGSSTPDGDPWTGYQSLSVKEAVSVANVTMTNGGTTNVTLGFTPVTQKNFVLDYKGSAFNALLPAGITDPVYASLSVAMEAGAPNPGIGTFANLWYVSVASETAYTNADPACQGAGCDPMACATTCDPGTVVLPGDHAHTYSYGNPFQYGQELFTVMIGFTKNVRPLLPEMTTERLRGFISITAPASEVTGKPIQPIVSLPQNIKVGGNATPYDQITTGVGNTPAVSWDAPTLGTPSYYRVTVYDLKDLTGADGTTSFRRIVGTMITKGTQVTIPAGVLQTGTNYYIQVAAEVEANYDSGKPFVISQHAASARMFTGVVTP